MDWAANQDHFVPTKVGILNLEDKCPATVFRARIQHMIKNSPSDRHLTHFFKILSQLQTEAITTNTLLEREFLFYTDPQTPPLAALCVLVTHATILSAVAVYVLLHDVFNESLHEIDDLNASLAFLLVNHTPPSALLLIDAFTLDETDSDGNPITAIICDAIKSISSPTSTRVAVLQALRALVDIRVYESPYKKHTNLEALAEIIHLSYFQNDWFFAGVDVPSLIHAAYRANIFQHHTHKQLHAYQTSTLAAPPKLATNPELVFSENSAISSAIDSQNIAIAKAALCNPPIFTDAQIILTHITQRDISQILRIDLNIFPSVPLVQKSPFAAPIHLTLDDLVVVAYNQPPPERAIPIIDLQHSLSDFDQHAICHILNTPDAYTTVVFMCAAGIYQPPRPHQTKPHIPYRIIAPFPIIPHIWNHILLVQTSHASARRAKYRPCILEISSHIIKTVFAWQQEFYNGKSIPDFIVLLIQCLFNIRRYALSDSALTDQLMQQAINHIATFPNGNHNIAIHHLLMSPATSNIITVLDPDLFQADIRRITRNPISLPQDLVTFTADMHHCITTAFSRSNPDSQLENSRFVKKSLQISQKNIKNPLAYFNTPHNTLPAFPTLGPFPDHLISNIAHHFVAKQAQLPTDQPPMTHIYFRNPPFQDPPSPYPSTWPGIHTPPPPQPTTPDPSKFDTSTAAAFASLFHLATTPQGLATARSLLSLPTATPIHILQLWAHTTRG